MLLIILGHRQFKIALREAHTQNALLLSVIAMLKVYTHTIQYITYHGRNKN
jgi:hypothetical protein